MTGGAALIASVAPIDQQMAEKGIYPSRLKQIKNVSMKKYIYKKMFLHNVNESGSVICQKVKYSTDRQKKVREYFLNLQTKNQFTEKNQHFIL